MSAQTHAPATNRSGATQDATKAPATVARATPPARTC